MNSINPAAAAFLANVTRIEARIAAANQQVSSGKRLTSPSDAPAQVGGLLQLRADQQRNTQIRANLSLAKADAGTAEFTLGSATTVIDRGIDLAIEAGNDTQNASTRQNIAQEVEALMQHLVGLSQTQVQGRFIFSGDDDGKPYYEINLQPVDPNTPPDPAATSDAATLMGVTQLSTANATRRMEDPAGGTFAVCKTAQEIFGKLNDDGTPAPTNALAALNSLRTALLMNDSTGISNSLDSLKQSSAHIINMQAFYGTVQSRIDDATSFGATYDVQLKTQLSELEDADIPGAALELSQANTQLQAAFQMQAKMPSSSLFNYLG